MTFTLMTDSTAALNLTCADDHNINITLMSLPLCVM